jgi:hypothetical protein
MIRKSLRSLIRTSFRSGFRALVLSLVCMSVLGAFGSMPGALAAGPGEGRGGSRIVDQVNAGSYQVLRGTVHPLANALNDRGGVPESTAIARMQLVLKRSAAQDKALAAAIKEMQRPGSSTYHKWLTPEQIGARYGAAQADLAKVTNWLTGAGFSVTSVSKARGVIEFSGTAGQVNSAFRTEIHSYSWKGGTYTGNAKDPSIPAALAPVVAGFVSLNNFPVKGTHADPKRVKFDSETKTWAVVGDKSPQKTGSPIEIGGKGVAGGNGGTGSVRPDMTTNKTNDGQTLYAVTPYDFATIYNLKPLWNAGIDGTGQQIAVVAESDISPGDVDQFRAAFGLPAKRLNIIHNGTAPGLQGDQDEASLDVEWAGAVAKNATVDLVVSASTAASAGVYLSMTYAVDNLTAPVLSESYETCESALGPAGNLFFYQTWQQAAAEGITVVVASGDSGSAACDIDPYSIAENGLAVNGFASTPYNVAVGGTDFAVNITNPTPYWGATNDPKTQASALGYIPEVPWNNTCASPEVFAAFGGGSGDTSPAQWCDDYQLPGKYVVPEGGGGGASACTSFDAANYPNRSYCAAGYAKPDWQAGVNGIPTDGVRDLPDVSFFASYLTFGSAYLYCMTDPQYVPTCNYNTGTGLEYLASGGTSFSAPAFAGVMALINQKTNSQQGLANYYLYSLASKEYGSASAPNSSQTNACWSGGSSGAGPGAGNSCSFYDVTEGTNAVPCFIGSWDCINGPQGYAGVQAAAQSTPGYDLVTGLGSANIENLVNNWAVESAATQATTITLTASPTLSTYGQAVMISGTVAPASGAGVPVGSVSIQGNGANQISIPVVNGTFSQAVAGLQPGAYTIVANYVGDGGFQNSTSAPVSVTVAAATAASSLTISAADVRSGAPIASGNDQVPYGDQVVATMTVTGAGGAGLTGPGGAGVISAGVAAPTGSVTFSSGGTKLSTVALNAGTATYQTVAGHVGAYSITASYSGDANYNPSPASTVAYSEVQAPTSVEAHSSAALVASGSTAQLIATVSSTSHAAPPTGKVTLLLNGKSVGTADLIPGFDPVTSAGMATGRLTVAANKIASGTNVVTAVYSGDANFMKSTSGASSFVDLTGADGTVMTMTSSTTTATNTTAVKIVAALTLDGAPVTLGSVNFMDNGKLFATVPVAGLNAAAGYQAGTATLTTRLTPGVHNFVGIYSGAGNLIHPNGNGIAPITVTGEQITATSISAVSDAGSPANYDVTATVVAGGATAPSGTLTLTEPSIGTGGGSTLRSVALDPSKAVLGPAAEIPVATGSQDSTIVSGDFNGDGIPDFAATSDTLPTQLMVYLGKGDGTFQAGVGSVVTIDPTVTGINGIAVGDFNADGVTDIVVSFVNGNTAVSMLGKGDGTFTPGQVLSVTPVGGAPVSVLGNIVVSDFNSDGIQDIAFANDGGLGGAAIEVFFGVGDGSFASSPSVIANAGDSDAPVYPVNLSTGDLNNDGKADLVAFNDLDGVVGVFLGNGDGTFQSEVTYPVGDLTTQGALGDLNHDGYLDIVAPNRADQNVAVLINNQDGTFASPVDYPAASVQYPPLYYYPEPWDVSLADMNGDGELDIVVADSHTNQVSVLYGKTGGGFKAYTPWLVNTAAGPYQVLLTDLNNDGRPDVLVNEPISSQVGVLLNGQAWTTSVLNVPLFGATTEKETLTGTYSGDGANLGSTSAALTLMGSGVAMATKLDWTPAVVTAVFGTGVPAGALNAQVENGVAGTIAYLAQGAGASVPVTAGSVLPAAGTYILTAMFTPADASDYAPSSASAAFVVTKAGVTETLSSSAAQVAPGAAVTLTDVLVSKTSGLPTGVVSFFAGTSNIGSATIDATGTASIAVSTLPVGSYSITTSYLGDGNFLADTSAAPLTVVVGSPGIVLGVNSPALTIVAGSNGTEAVTVTPQLGYTGNVTFTCSGLPAGVSCAFAPSAGAVGAGGFQSTLTVTTAGPGSASAQAQSRRELARLGAGGAVLMASALFWLPGRRKRIAFMRTWLTLLVVVAISLAVVGCGGGGSKTTPPPTGPTASTLAVSSSASKTASGGFVTLTATLGGTNAATATGGVTFYDGGTKIGQANVANGTATLAINTLSVGAHSITAGYAGDSQNEASVSGTGFEQVITGQTTFTVTAISGSISQSSTVNLTLQ